MEKEKFNNKIKSIRTMIKSIQVKNSFDEMESREAGYESDFDFDYHIIENTRERAEILLNVVIRLKPDTPFIIEIEYKVEMNLDEPITNNDINKNIEDITAGIGGQNSLMIAFLTGQLLGNPLVIPPTLDFKKKR